MRPLIASMLVLLLTLVVSNTSYGQGKNGKKGKSTVTSLETTAQDYEALAKHPGVAGRVIAINPATETMTLRIEYQIAEATGKPGAQIKLPKIPIKNFKPRNNNRPKKNNFKKNRPNQNRNNKNKNRPGKNRNNNRNVNNPKQLQREWMEIQRIQNPAQRQKRMAQFMQKVNKLSQQQKLAQMKWMQQQAQQMARIQQQQARQMAKIQQQLIKNANKNGQGNPAVKVSTFAKEFTLSISPSVRVAKKQLGIEYDDKGNIKQYAPEELKKMQDEKLPGYKATLEEVLPGLDIYVYLGKADPKAKEKKVDISDLIGGNAPGAILAKGPTVLGILILSEPGLGGLVDDNKKRKKQ